MIFLQLIANGLINGVVYALVAIGFALIYNTTRVFHIAYAVLYTLSPYILYSLYNIFNLSFFMSFLISIFATIILSISVEFFIYQPLHRIKSSLNVILVSSIGFMIIIVNLIALTYGNETKIINHNISPTISIASLIFKHIQIWQFGIGLSIISLYLFYLKYSKLGIKIRAIRDNEVLSQIFTVNVKKIRFTLFGISAFFVAIAGNLVAFDLGIDPYIGLPAFLTAVVALIVGGIGNFFAPVIGGLVIGLLQSITIFFFSARWQDAVVFILLIIFLMFRPQGILGEKERSV